MRLEIKLQSYYVSDNVDIAGYHPDHHGSPMGSPGDDFHQSRLKPDIELAR